MGQSKFPNEISWQPDWLLLLSPLISSPQSSCWRAWAGDRAGAEAETEAGAQLEIQLTQLVDFHLLEGLPQLPEKEAAAYLPAFLLKAVDAATQGQSALKRA